MITQQFLTSTEKISPQQGKYERLLPGFRVKIGKYSINTAFLLLLQPKDLAVRHMRKAYLFHLFFYTLRLPYLHTLKLTHHSGPGVGTARQHQTASLLRPNTKGHYHWNLSHNTI